MWCVFTGLELSSLGIWPFLQLFIRSFVWTYLFSLLLCQLMASVNDKLQINAFSILTKVFCSAVYWHRVLNFTIPDSHIIMIVIIIIMVIALKGSVEDFYDLLTAPQTVSNTCTQVARAQSCANHMQHF